MQVFRNQKKFENGTFGLWISLIKIFETNRLDGGQRHCYLIRQHTPRRPKIGYFGHLYEGRGVEIVLDLSLHQPDCDIYIVGGEPDLVEQFRSQDTPDNVYFLGFQPNSVARAMMMQMDTAQRAARFAPKPAPSLVASFQPVSLLDELSFQSLSVW